MNFAPFAKYLCALCGHVWHGGFENEAGKLAECYKNSLKLAIENNCRTVAFPNISTGIYGFPKEEAARIAFKTVKDFLAKSDKIEKVSFVCFDEENEKLMKKLISFKPLQPPSILRRRQRH